MLVLLDNEESEPTKEPTPEPEPAKEPKAAKETQSKLSPVKAKCELGTPEKEQTSVKSEPADNGAVNDGPMNQ